MNEPQRRREHREKRNRENFCVSFGIFFLLGSPSPFWGEGFRVRAKTTVLNIDEV
jgi:hypothetical protein